MLEPRAVLGQRARMPEVVGGRMFDHTVFDVAAFRRVVVGVISCTGLIHTAFNLPTSAENESAHSESESNG